MNKQKSYHHPTKNPNYFSHTNYFFYVQLGHPKLSGYGLLSTPALQNRSQKYFSVSQSGATAFPWRDPGPPAQCRPKGVNSDKDICFGPSGPKRRSYRSSAYLGYRTLQTDENLRWRSTANHQMSTNHPKARTELSCGSLVS